MSSPGTRLEIHHSAQGSAQSKAKLQVLLVEDNAADADLLLDNLRREGFDGATTIVKTVDEFRRQVKEEVPDIILADYNLGNWKGVEALEILHGNGLDIPVIMVTGGLGEVNAVDCIKRGATDCVLKDALARLPEAIHRAMREKHERSLRHQAEHDLACKVEELARSNADLEQFAYVASHDLQEPLRMVAAYTQLLAERYRGRLDENADKFISYASEGALRMQVIVKDLLTFSRVGRDGTISRDVDCNALVEGILQSLASTIKESGAVVTHGELPTVWAHPTQLVQVFQNLIGNAIKFRGNEPPVVSVEAEKAGADWVFTVSDNGIGIAPEHAESIFVVFQRLHSRSEYAGNGIGLAICKKIVELCGGKIWVESQAGQGSAGHGSTFKFTMPAHGPEQRVREQP